MEIYQSQVKKWGGKMRLKLVFSLMLLTFIVALNGSVILSFAAVPKGLVLYLTFDNDTISGKEIKDVSQNGNNGAIIGGPKVVDGHAGQALDFNGSSDSVVIETSDSLAKTKSAITMEAWIFPRAFGADREVITKWDNAMNGIVHFEGSPTGNMRFCMRKDDDSKVVDFNTTATLPVNAWSHVAETYDGKTAKVYFDGAEVSSQNGTGDMRDNPNVKWWIGAMYAQDRWFNGLIDEVRIWDRALSEKEIKENMNKGRVELLAVNKKGKLTTAWGLIKSNE
jgi:hypothetical protein